MLAPSPQTTQASNISPWVGGINAAAPLYGMPVSDCLYTYNLIAGELGMRVRPGTVQWVTGIPGGDVKSIMPFHGADGADDQLFCASTDGIYQITTPAVPPVLEVTFVFQGGVAGEMIHTNYTNDAGSWLLACDESNGYYTYSPLGVWSQPALTNADGFDETEAVFVTLWKNRVWFCRRNSAKAYYLDAQAVSGATTAFNFGNKFTRGGHLVGLFSWTIDGGNGLDDYLVAISHEGDCLVYKGTDPDTIDFGLVGSYFVGEMPEGRRVATDYGGDLIILSTHGAMSLTSLLRGEVGNKSYLTQKISKLIRQLMDGYSNSFGWSLHVSARNSLLIITAPTVATQRTLQFVMDTTTHAWSMFRDLDMLSAATYRDTFYMGMPDGNVYALVGSADTVNIDGSGNEGIYFSTLGSYQDMGTPATFKRMQFLRPTFRAESSPTYKIKAAYDYDFDEALFSGNPAFGQAGIWQPDGEVPPYDPDVSLWDEVTWGGFLASSWKIVGAAGMGRTVAIALSGTSKGNTELVDINVMWDSGGVL